MGSKKPSKRVVQFLFTSRHTVPTSIPSSNYSPNLRRSCVKLPHILSRMPHSPSGASARPSPHVSIKSLELNALHTSQIQDMVHLNGNRSNGVVRLHSGSSIALIRTAEVPAQPVALASGTRFQRAYLWHGRGAARRPSRRSFFKCLLGFFIRLRMARAHREPAVVELRQNLADRAFVQRDAEAPLQLVAQIHAPPAHHPVTSRVGARLDQPGQLRLLFGREFRLGTRWRQIVQPGQALGVVAMHPIPQGLPIHAAGFGRRLAIRPVEHQRKCQYPPRCCPVLLPARSRPESRCRHIKPSDRNRCTHRCCSSFKSQHRVRLSLIWESSMSQYSGPLVLVQ